jgi:hypothetical protein
LHCCHDVAFLFLAGRKARRLFTLRLPAVKQGGSDTKMGSDLMIALTFPNAVLLVYSQKLCATSIFLTM